VAEVADVVATMSEVAANGQGTVESVDINPLVFTDEGRMAAIDVRVQLREPSIDETSA